MKLLIVNLHSSQNAGDHALTIEAIKQLRAAFPGSTLTLALNDPEGQTHEGAESIGSFATWLRRGRGWSTVGLARFFVAAPLWALLWRLSKRDLPLGLTADQRRLLLAYAHADLIASCAGHVFTSGAGRGFSLLLAVMTLGYGLLFGKMVITLPQSFGPWRGSAARWLFRRLASHLTLLLAREPLAAAALATLGIPAARVRLVPDLALAYEGRDEARASTLLGTLTAEALGVTVINWGAQHRLFSGQQRYEAAVTAALRQFRKQTGAPVYLFSQVWGPTDAEDDRVPARRIATALADPGVHLIDEPLDPATLRSLYGRMALLLGTRMHSNIFALSAGTPVVAIGYRDKTRGIMEMAGLSEWVLDIEQVSEAALTERLLAAWASRAALRDEVRRAVAPLKREAATIGAIVAETWEAHHAR